MTEMSNMVLTEAVIGLAWLIIFNMFLLLMVIYKKEDK